MLNRLYIVLGSLLIVTILAAFIAPYLIDWSDRRAQLESLASEALGAEVIINGDIDFQLLPQPRLSFGDVVVGPPEDPVAEVASAEAFFSLMDFLRDQFVVTRLTLGGPHLYLHVDETGAFDMPFSLAERVSASNVSIADAIVTDGAITVSDSRNGSVWRADDVEGALTLSALRGPFGFNATGNFEGVPYQARINTSPLNSEGALQMAVFLRPVDGRFSLNLEGLLQTGGRPHFDGRAILSAPPPPDEDSVLGDMVMEANVDATPERVRLTNYVLVPDENRAGTRLTGAASLLLGVEPEFEAVISGGVVALAPRDARETSDEDPYEFLRFLNELPAAPVPPLPGRIGVDVAELNLQVFALRNVRLDAVSDGENWQIETFSGRLPGDTQVNLTGRFGGAEGRAEFDGAVSMQTDRLDALVQLWRRPDERSPLFGVSAALNAEVELSDGLLVARGGSMRIGGANMRFSGTLPEPGGHLEVAAALGTFDRSQSAILAAALPDFMNDGAFASSFAGGAFDLSAEQAELFGLLGSQLAARGSWDTTGIRFGQLAAGDFGGASFTLSGDWIAGERRPVIAGGGRLILNEAAVDGALALAFEEFGIAPQVQPFLTRALPASLEIALEAPDEEGTQAMEVTGDAGVAEVQFAANLAQGITAYRQGPVGVRMELGADNPAALMAQLGFDIDLPTTGRTRFVAIGEGAPSNSMDVQFTLDTDADKMQFTGNAILSDLTAVKGRGQLEFVLPEPAAWGAALGAAGLYLPPLDGVAELSFTGASGASLTAITADADGTPVTGEIVRSVEAGLPLYSGALNLGAFDIGGLASLMTGGAALLDLEGGVWPDGPIAEPDGARPTRGRISILAEGVEAGGRRVADAVDFDVVWDARDTRIRGLSAVVGDGELLADVTYCCTGTAGPKQVTGRVTLVDVAAGALVPEATSDVIAARLTGSLQLDGTGETLAEIVASLTGEGSFTATDLEIAGFDPNAFTVAAETEDLLELEADALTTIVSLALGRGPFTAQELNGVLSLAGGTLRAGNLAAENQEALLYGSAGLNFSDLSLSGNWTMSPQGEVGDGELINESTARIVATLGGTLTAPERELNLAQLVDAIQVRAFELEVDRLEQIRAEDEARARAAAEERARLMALEARRQAEEAARQAAEEEAARQAAEAEAAEEQGDATDPPAADTEGDAGAEETGDDATAPPLDLLPPPGTQGGRPSNSAQSSL